jgi:hypothetical protein
MRIFLNHRLCRDVKRLEDFLASHTQADRNVRSRVIMNIHIQLSESLSRPEPENGSAAEGNCVAARQGGEQLEAESQSRTKVNLIRLEEMASLRETGEACSEKNGSCGCQNPENIEHEISCSGWSENAMKGVYLNGENCVEKTRSARTDRTVVRAAV